MREMVPRPFLLALVILVSTCAVLYLETDLGSARPDAAREVRAVAAGGPEDAPVTARDGGAARREGVKPPQEVLREPTGRVARKERQFDRAPEIAGPAGFINAEDVSIREARGENVVLVEFWTYTCINCQNVQPHLNAWHERYADEGLKVVGVHTPEFDFEKEHAGVEEAVRQAGIRYPVVLDNDHATWNAYDNRYWPAIYLIDADGFVRHRHFGEGSYGETEEKIRELLAEKERPGG